MLGMYAGDIVSPHRAGTEFESIARVNAETRKDFGRVRYQGIAATPWVSEEDSGAASAGSKLGR
jgi:hypothetical protein